MKQFLNGFLILSALAGCTVGPDYKRPTADVPEQWHETPLSTASKSAELDEWWRTFNDPILNRLISDAIASNLDFRQALNRIKDARIQYSAIIAAGLPSLTARSNVSRRFNNTSSGTQTSGSTTGSGFGVGNQLINIYQMGFDAQWEIDLFGGERRAIQAASATADAELENSRAVLVSLLGEVARLYIALRLNQQLLAITQKHLSIRQETLQLSEVRRQAGLSNALEVTQAAAQVKTTEAELPNYQSSIAQTIHALGILVGRSPGALFARLERPGELPETTATVIPELPSELLQRRPDIRHAEREMAIATAQVGIATSELYPKINLAAFIGLQNLNISGFTPLGKSWSTAGSLSMPIFNWGKLNANLKSKKLQSEQTFLTYQSTLLTAFKEVEDSLVAYNRELTRHKTLSQALEVRQLALKLANELYQKGLSNFIDVLDSQVALAQAEQNLLASSAQLSTHLIALYKALGGGWQTEATVNQNLNLKIKPELF